MWGGADGGLRGLVRAQQLRGGTVRREKRQTASSGCRRDALVRSSALPRGGRVAGRGGMRHEGLRSVGYGPELHCSMSGGLLSAVHRAAQTAG